MGARANQGFTLMELMMVLTVFGIIVALGIPSFHEFSLNGRMPSAANDLLASLQLARSEAIKRQRPVAICGSADPDASPPTCAEQFTGWVVWVDTDDDGEVDATEEVLQRHSVLDPKLSATSIDRDLALITNNSFMSYGPDGFTR